ncbi:CoA transferase [Streptomyces sp. HC44]|uniref:CoA transferase n=1 Tax=Streptomyces scabichelini TaxID=2711217 RepID=A0A6G4VHR6_9ACTN|nr:CoA transferase [Streptomyces scabichelini]NGO13698.1 CoA transferase [Streptomyces scabichelini]
MSGEKLRKEEPHREAGRLRTGPLTGLRVLDLAELADLTGPGRSGETSLSGTSLSGTYLSGMMLAGLGADVVRVGRPADADAVLALAVSADVLVEGGRPGTAERLGIGPERCLARNPRLVYGRTPVDPGPGEPTAALCLTVGVLAALAQVARTGQGQIVDGTLAGCPYYSVYWTADGHQMAVGAVEPDCYREFVRLLGVWEMVPDHREPSVWAELRRLFAGTFRTRTRREWCEVFDGTPACVSPLLPPRA